MYKKIVNPETGRKVNINGIIGKKIVNNYLNNFIGGSVGFIVDKSALRVRPRMRARSHSRSLSECDHEESDGSNCLDAEWIGFPRAGQHVSIRVSASDLLAPRLS